jgi:Holliday junction DNA helicase RuvA
MISYLRGKIVVEKPGFMVLDVGGVGYKVFRNQSGSLKVQESESQDLEFFVYQNIREDTSDLYGFASFEELELFEKLISVNGVGPKAGMQIMSAASPNRIIAAITNEDLSFFTAVPGIGKKVAAKIILELKSKLSGLDGSGVISQTDGGDEVVEALASLGYKPVEIIKLIPNLPAGIADSEGKIRWLLKNLHK